jgi:hypothetical protein
MHNGCRSFHGDSVKVNLSLPTDTVTGPGKVVAGRELRNWPRVFVAIRSKLAAHDVTEPECFVQIVHGAFYLIVYVALIDPNHSTIKE